MPDFEVLDARIVSAQNRIIHNSPFKWRVSLEEQKAQKQDRFLRGRQIAYLIYEYFRAYGSHDSVENYTDLFTIVLRNDDIQECDSKWNGILLSMAKSHLMTSWNDCTNSEYESGKLKTALELYDLEIQKKLRPDYHKLKTMVKRSIEQDIRNENFGARNGNYERNAVMNQVTNSVDKEFLEIVGIGIPTDSVLKETIAVSATISLSVENYTSESVSEFFHAAEWAKIIEDPKSQEKKSQRWTVSMALQRLP